MRGRNDGLSALLLESNRDEEQDDADEDDTRLATSVSSGKTQRQDFDVLLNQSLMRMVKRRRGIPQLPVSQTIVIRG